MSDQIAFDPAVSMARQSLYRFAALALTDPQKGAWSALDALRRDATITEAAAFIRSRREAKPKKLGPGERPIGDLQPQAVLDQLAPTFSDHNSDYENTFGLLASNTCPPYESEYISGKLSYQRAHVVADISGFYRAFGLTVTETQPERHDHLALELEFMAFLIGMERHSGNDPAARAMRRFVCRAAQARFFKEHVAWWAPVFARLLAHENPGGFYEAAGRFIAALIPTERALLNVGLTSQPAPPSAADAPDACEGCRAIV